MVVVAGIDVSKATLDVSVSEGDVCRFNNTGKGISSLLKHIERQGVTKAVCESTGGYERLVGEQDLAWAANSWCRWHICFSVRAFARACGYEAKTDPLDAQVLSRYGLVFSVSDRRATQRSDPDREELRQLLSQSSSTGRAACTGAQPSRQGRKCERREVDQAAHPLAG